MKNLIFIILKYNQILQKICNLLLHRLNLIKMILMKLERIYFKLIKTICNKFPFQNNKLTIIKQRLILVKMKIKS